MAEYHAVDDDIAVLQAESAPMVEETAEVSPVTETEQARRREAQRISERTRNWYRRRYGANYGQSAFQLATLLLEILIAFRVFLKLIDANPDSGFAWFVYGITAPFLAPFNGLTSTPQVHGSVLEIPSLIAMVVYLILFWLILRAWRLVAAW
ncbi:MAG: hypothetical protein ACK2UK_18415 [Candidatus Promineifilaceae bacterium]